MRLLIGTIMLSSVAAAPALAQGHPQTRQGFTISFGLGAGSAGTTCDGGCPSDREWAPTLYLRLGGALRPNLILAGEINGWSKDETDDSGTDFRLTTTTINALAQWYPDPAGGFFVSGGAGIGSVRLEARQGAVTLSTSTNAFGYQVGTGYDVRLGSNFSLTPFATYYATAGGKFEESDVKLDGNVFHFGLGVTWH